MARLALAAALVAAACVSAAAQTASRGDPARGRQQAEQVCAACHGPEGRSSVPGVPSLAGQQPEFMAIVLILLREQVRDTPAMNAIAQALSDREIEDLAAWFASLPPGPPEDRGPRDPALAERGRALSARMNCGVCHLPDYSGRNQVPRLAGQREEVLVHAMTGYRDGTRRGSDTNMNAAMHGVSDDDIRALAHHLAHHR
ncbi:MAG TPA: c-type cytochrome [Acetobacteraceae bacterium]|nr:c-type cytochrome [Acetobacteraceae bacterium]